MEPSLSVLTAISGPAIFFDGVTSARHTVTVDLGLTALAIHARRRRRRSAEWPYGAARGLRGARRRAAARPGNKPRPRAARDP